MNAEATALNWYLPKPSKSPFTEAPAIELSNLAFQQAISQHWLEPNEATQQLIQTSKTVLPEETWALAQMNPAPGDLAGNAKKIADAIHLANELELEGLVFPELALMGYPIRDVIIRFPSLVQAQVAYLMELAKLTKTTRVFVGVVEPRPASVGKPYFNSVAILGEGKLLGVIRKSLLPTYHEYEEWRTFQPTTRPGLWSAEAFGQGAVEPISHSPLYQLPSGKRVAITICEDSWNQPGLPGRQLYATEPVSTLLEHQPNLWLNMSASVGRLNKQAIRDKLFSQLAHRTNAPWLYVNQSGAVDECCFEGTTSLYNSLGELKARGLAYQEQLLLVNPWSAEGPIYPLPEDGIKGEVKPASIIPGWRRELPTPPPAELIGDEVGADKLAARLYAGLICGLKDYFKKTGFKRATIGLSGGIDSAVTAVLLADALGPENVLVATMPSGITPDENQADAELLAKNLGLACINLPINQLTEAFLPNGLEQQRQAMNDAWGTPNANSFAKDNVQAMTRASFLRLIGNEYNALPVATSDKSEFYLGYTTVNGDMSGAISPLGDVTKSRVRLLARWLNKYRHEKDVIPEAVITRPSGADLAIDPKTGKPLTAEDALMPYAFADEIIWRIEVLAQSRDEMAAITFHWEEKNSPLSAEKKADWLDKFFSRMNRSLYKWWIAPPVILIDEKGSLTKTEYHHPMTACKIDWRLPNAEQLREQLAPPTAVLAGS